MLNSSVIESAVTWIHYLAVLWIRFTINSKYRQWTVTFIIHEYSRNKLIIMWLSHISGQLVITINVKKPMVIQNLIVFLKSGFQSGGCEYGNCQPKGDCDCLKGAKGSRVSCSQVILAVVVIIVLFVALLCLYCVVARCCCSLLLL